MNLKNFLLLLSLFFFNALSATLEEDQKAFFEAAIKYDLNEMKKILDKNNLENQKLIIQCEHVHPKSDVCILTPFEALCDTFKVFCDAHSKTTDEQIVAITYIAEHRAFDPNFKTSRSTDNQLYILIKDILHDCPHRDALDEVVKKLLCSDKCTEQTTSYVFRDLTERLFSTYERTEDKISKIKKLLVLMKVKKKTIRQAFDLAYEKQNKEIAQWLLESFPAHNFKGTINRVLRLYFKADQERKEFINLLLDHGINDCNIYDYKDNKKLFDNPNKLSINGKCQIRGLSFAGLSAAFIATTCYDFITFQPLTTKKEEPVQKKNSNTQNTDDQIKTSSEINSNKKIEEPSKKETIEEEKKERSLWEKSTSHTKAYALDLWKNPRNHKKLIVAPIGFFCLALKDKIPYLKLI